MMNNKTYYPFTSQDLYEEFEGGPEEETSEDEEPEEDEEEEEDID